MKAKDIPNIISIIRILLVAPVILMLYQGHYITALILFLVAGVSDALDGYLAKRYGWTSQLGSMLDPLADKLLLVCSYGMLAWLGNIPVWLVVTIIARDIIILAGSFGYYLLYGRYEVHPSWISKLNTFAQIIMVLFVVASLGLINVDTIYVSILVYFVFLTTLLSGLDYIVTWGAKAWRNRFERY